MYNDTSKFWFALALEFRAYGYSFGEFLVALAFAHVAVTGDAQRAIARAYTCTMGGDE